MIFLALLLQAASPVASSVTLAETKTMSSSALADRLLPERDLRPIVDVIINGRGGLTPPSLNVYRVWLVEQMVPFDTAICRSHVFEIQMAADDPKAAWSSAVPTHPVKVEQHDRLWIPPGGEASQAACTSAPSTASGFSARDLDLRHAATLIEQARDAFARAKKDHSIAVSCSGEPDTCGQNPRDTLAGIDWSALTFVEPVGNSKLPDGTGGPANIRLTFPYAANGSTWIITVDRDPDVTAVRMDAHMIVYD